MANGFRGPLTRELLRQSFHTSLPQLLRYADRDSMAHGREVRLPFLSREVAEFGLSLPPDFVYRNGVTKSILRDAVRGVVPTVVLERVDKIGFETPQAAWLSERDWLSRIGDVLLDPAARTRGLSDTQTIEADLRRQRWRDPAGIWRVFNVELWLRAFEHSSPTARALAR
jgi:asparagine synthase (glutamine-hydrolysing)